MDDVGVPMPGWGNPKFRLTNVRLTDYPGVGWEYLPADWLRITLPDWEGWTLDVRAAEVDGQVRCTGLRVIPPEGTTVTDDHLRTLRPDYLAAIASRARILDMTAMRAAIAAPDKRRPYGGSAEHTAAVLRVEAEAKAMGENASQAVARVFDVPRKTAYRWLADAHRQTGQRR